MNPNKTYKITVQLSWRCAPESRDKYKGYIDWDTIWEEGYLYDAEGMEDLITNILKIKEFIINGHEDEDGLSVNVNILEISLFNRPTEITLPRNQNE